MKRAIICSFAILALILPQVTQAEPIQGPIGSPVDHPVFSRPPIATAGQWRKGVERFGEDMVAQSLRLRGYEVRNLKLPGNHGIDLIAIRRTPTGTIRDIRLCEVKTHYGKSKPRLGKTLAGTQMSRTWLAEKLRALRCCGEEGKSLALEISRFRRGRGVPIGQLAEIHDINLRLGKYTIRDSVAMTERGRPIRITRVLNRIASRAEQAGTRAWALQHIAQLDQVRQAQMTRWLTGGKATRSLVNASGSRLAIVEAKQATRGAGRAFTRVVGPVGLFIATAMELYEGYGHVRNYQEGRISHNELMIALARTGGGFAGAMMGSAAGAWVGAEIGAFGGPAAWFTVPAGTVVGAAVGGASGYFAGAYVGEAAAQRWYASLDKDISDEVGDWMKKTPVPALP